MKTKHLAILLSLTAAGAPLLAQPATATAPAEPRVGNRPAEQNRRPTGNTPMQREGRADPGPQPGNPAVGPNQPQMHKPDPFMESFFPPEVIMHHQQAINLTDEQRKRMIETIQKAQPQFTELQWQLEAEQSALNALMRSERPDEKQIIAQLDKVMRLESDMKRGQLTMLVRLKNELTAEQQQKLREASRPRFPGMMGPNGPMPQAQPPRMPADQRR